MSDKDKLIEELKTEIMSLKIRLSRIEEYLGAFPNIKEYVELTPRAREKFTDEKDELFNDAVELVGHHEMASASLLQRRFKIGFNRAARLIEQLEEEGIVEKGYGSKPRKVIKQTTA